MKRSHFTGYPIMPGVKKRRYIRNLSPFIRFFIQTATMAAMIIIGTMCGAFLVSYFTCPYGSLHIQCLEWAVFFLLCFIMNICLDLYCAARSRLK